MDNKIVMISIAAVIGIIVLGSVLMPIMNDATATTDTFTNDGYYRMAALDSESTYKLYWDHTKPYEVTVNDTDVFSLAGLQNYQAVTLIGSDKFTLRFFSVSDNPRVQLYGGTGYGFGGASVTSGTDMTVIVSAGSITITTNAAESPLNITNVLPDKAYAIIKDGDYTMKKAGSDAYVLKDSSIMVICGLTESSGVSAAVYGEGTVEDGMDYVLFRPAADSDTAVFSNESISYTDVEDHVGLAKVSSINFSVTVTAGTVSPIYTYFIVPYEVTAERAVHFTDGQNAIFAAIPVLIILAVLLGVVALVIRSRMD